MRCSTPVTLVDVVVETVGGDESRGIDNDGIGFTLQQGRVTASWGTSANYGIFNQSGADNLRVEDSRISATFGSALVRTGVEVGGADVTFRNVEVSGLYGIELKNFSDSFANAQLFDVYVSATEYALTVNDQEGNGCMVMIDDGRYNAGVDAVINIGSRCDLRIGGAYLANGVTGTALCAGVYDWGHTFYPNTCPP